ncbi:MAG: hypothetical protein Q9159_004095 [Coniocarpon cinnabarinum]
MATAKVIYLSPRFVKASEPSFGQTLRLARRARFSTSSYKRRPEAATSRYGTANEPPPHLGGGRAIPLSPPPDTQEKDAKKLPDPRPEERKLPAKAQTTQQEQSTAQATESERNDAETHDTASADNATNQAEAQPATPAPPPTTSESHSALQNILQMGAPMSTASDTAPPHLQTPRHVHHFDTYSLVRDLISSKTFSEEQAITLMKVLRVILTDNIHLARAGLLSRSDAEMDAYQFRAASSELRTELRQRRDGGAERMRADRSQLQHEVDILGQRMTQESLNLKDELRGMFDDRKMGVRTERRVLDNRIQELGYKITVAMNSGMRNEIESLRFLVTRNAAITLAAFVFGSLGALYMASRKKARGERAEKEGRDREEVERRLRDGAVNVVGKGRDELVSEVERGGDPSLVSLG